MRYMHAKLASDIVNAAQKSRYDVYLNRGPITVDAKSILGLMSLYNVEGCTVICEDPAIILEIEAIINAN